MADGLKNYIHPSTRFYQYADDLLLLQSTENGADEDNLQSSLDGVQNWCVTSGLQVNNAKSKLVKFSRGRKDDITTYHCGDELIPEVEHIKYLGLIIDRKLSFNKYVNTLRERPTRLMYAAARICSYIKKSQISVRLYRIYIEPIILYGSATWAGRTRIMMQTIENAHRIAYTSSSGDTNAPAFARL